MAFVAGATRQIPVRFKTICKTEGLYQKTAKQQTATVLIPYAAPRQNFADHINPKYCDNQATGVIRFEKVNNGKF